MQIRNACIGAIRGNLLPAESGNQNFLNILEKVEKSY
jgi:hypothetical protein